MTSLNPEAAAEDLALLSQAQAGDAMAARSLIRRLSPRAHALAWRMLGDAVLAEDVVQDALEKLFQVRQFRGSSRLSTYFHTMVSRLCIDRCRAREPLSFDTDLVEDLTRSDWIPGPDFQADQLDQASQIQMALKAMPPRQRLAISLWAYHDYTVMEIAQTLQVDRNVADQLLHRAKAGLRKKLEDLHEYAR